ncbi:MAG: GldG family protein, partial [Candidatus Aminicenantes bacterium]|nr:GldG family protein [Candidatus Aminicenantes bacterium]
MDTLKKYLNIVAVVLILAALAAATVWPYRNALILGLGAAGLLALAAYMLLHLPALKQGFRRRSFIYSGNMILVVVLVLAILVLVNYFLARHSVMIDLTAGKTHSLSDQTLQVLKGLKTDVSLKAFFNAGNYGRGAMENLLKLYAYRSARLKYEFIEPDKNPGLVKRYGITQDGTTVLEVGGKEVPITTTSEEDLTNALIKATRTQKKVIYFLEGHGEGGLEESGERGYSTVKGDLEKLGYEVKKFTLALADRFPSDCAVLVIGGPQKDLLPNEYETIRGYIKTGGRAVFLVDPETPTLLPIFLSDFGMKLENDIIVDRVARLLGGDYFIPIIGDYDASHPITAKFPYPIFTPLARSVDVAETKPEGASLTALAKTSENAYAKVGFLLKEKMTLADIAYVSGKDLPGPINVAVAGTYKFPAAPPAVPAGQPAETPPAPKPEPKEIEARLVVVGDSDFAKNGYLGMDGNGNFFLNIINWLTEEADLIAIQPKTQALRTMTLSPVRMSVLKLVVLYVLPFG